MDQLLLSSFIIKKDFEHEGVNHTRVYVMALNPYSPWDEIEAVLDQFKSEFATMKDNQAAQIKAAQDKEAADKAAEVSNPIEAEVVS